MFPSLLVGKLTTPHDSRGSVWGGLSAEKQTGIKLQFEPADGATPFLWSYLKTSSTVSKLLLRHHISAVLTQTDVF